MNINVTFREEQNNLDMSVKETDIFGVGFGSGGGTTDYNKLRHKPTINGVILEGDKSSEDLGLLTEEDLAALDGRVDTLEDEMDTAQGDITSLETALDGKAPAIYETASGDIASFADGADGMPVKSLVANIEPVQDLHGYDNPWPGGGGKNKLEVTYASQTVNGVTLTVGSDGMITTTGTATATVLIIIGSVPVSAEASYIINGCPSGGGGETYRLDARKDINTVLGQDAGSGATFTADSDINVYLRIGSGTTVSNLVFKPMIRLATETDATFAPYSNICPISGHTGSSVTRTGKNLWKLGGDFDSLWFNNMAIGATGKLTASTANARANIVKVNSGEQFVTSGFDLTQYAMSSVIRVFVTKEYPGAGVDAYRLANALNRSVITIPSGYNWLVCLTYVNTGVTLDMPAQLEYGTTPTDYEEYAGSTTTVSWQTEAGTVYGGTLDVTNGVLTVDKAYALLNDASKWVTYTQGNVNYIYQNSFQRKLYNDSYTGLICTVIKTESTGYLYGRWRGADNPYFGIYDYYGVLNLDTIKNMAEANQIAICYDIEPITYQLTPQELDTLFGTNNIWSDTGDVSIEYPCDTKLYIDGKIAEAIANALNA